MMGILKRTLLRASVPALLLLAAACATLPKPLTGIVPGREVETLQSPVTLSVRTADKSSGGRGVLIFKQPDRFRLAILSPFGPTLLEIFVDDERLTCLIPGKNTAYSGTFADLPEREGLRSWRLMRWVVERPPAPGPASFREFTRPDGSRERVYYDSQGLVSRKVSAEGDEVLYQDYQVIGGVAFPAAIELASRDGSRVKLTFEEPELNGPVEDGLLRPDLSGVTVLPFAAFQGF